MATRRLEESPSLGAGTKSPLSPSTRVVALGAVPYLRYLGRWSVRPTKRNRAALGAALLGWARSLRQSITSSHSAHASIIALDRDRPTATEPSALVGVTAVAAVASVVPLTVCRSPSVDPNAARSYVHTLSHTRRCGSHRHCANESHYHQCSRDQHGLSLLFLFCVLGCQHSEVCGCSVGNICSVEHKEVLYAAAEGRGSSSERRLR